MARKQLAIIASIAGAGALAFTLTAVKSGGKNDIGFTAVIAGLDNQSTPAAFSHTVVNDDGKVRVFKDADDVLKQAGALGLVTEAGMSIDFAGLALVQPKPFTGDIIKKNESLVAAYGTRKTAAQERSARLATEISLMGADPAVPAGTLAEKNAQKDSVDGLVTFLTAEIARINAILNPEL